MLPPEASPCGKTAPWQEVLRHEPPAYTGAAPYATAAPENTTSAGGGVSKCPGLKTLVGTTWHSPQATARDRGVPSRCVWCAPTPGEAVLLEPDRSVGGAGFALP